MFQIGQTYPRSELLKFIGSNQLQSGILWNKEGSDTIIITSGGRHGKSASYGDEMQDDGSWLYYGQGGKGDQNPHSAANSLLSNLDKKILLFTTREVTAKEAKERNHRKKQYLFEGMFKVNSWTLETANDGKRKGDKLVKYLLEPIEELEEVNMPVTDPLTNVVLEPSEFYNLRQKINNKKDKPRKDNIFVLTEYRDRSIQIKEYALLRAEGKCENCGHDAPFVNSNNIPFLEVHHIFSLSDDGPDSAVNVAAICPNCHREAHYGKHSQKLKEKLANKIQDKENKIDKNQKDI